MKLLAVWAAALCSSTLVVAMEAQQVLSSRTVLAVVSAGNTALVDLGVDDFVVQEAGAAREVLDVHIADYPLFVMLDDGAPAEEMVAIREAAARFVARVGDRGVAVGTMTGPAILVTLDEDRATAVGQIRALASRPGARLMPFEALAAAMRLVRETGAPFSAVVIISARAIDTGDVGSSELLRPIIDSRIPVHVIGHRTAAGVAESSGDLLREVSGLTRGQYTAIYSLASYAIALDRLADRLATEMMIQFLVPPGSTNGEVRVGVKVPGARVTGLGVSR